MLEIKSPDKTHPIEDCQYYIWEENRLASYEEFKEFYAVKDLSLIHI